MIAKICFYLMIGNLLTAVGVIVYTCPAWYSGQSNFGLSAIAFALMALTFGLVGLFVQSESI